MNSRLVNSFTLPHRMFHLIIVLAIVASGCGSDGGGDPIGNLAPSVAITGGPPESPDGGLIRDSYTARIFWTGWDEDGFIVHYEYVIDPPAAFTFEEISYPERHLVENGGTLSLLTVRGLEASSDTLLFSKPTADGPAVMSYIQTPEFSRSFAFETVYADSTVSGNPRPTDPPTFSSPHMVYVRSLDNEGDYSGVDFLGYTAETLTPTSLITSPKGPGLNVLNVGTTVRIQWEGNDPDSPEPSKNPVGYLYKMINVNDDVVPPLQLNRLVDPEFVMYAVGGNLPWIYQSADTLEKTFFLTAGKGYVFAVRAVDLAGAVEPRIIYSGIREDVGNALRLQPLPTGGRPKLTVTEPSLGTVRGPQAKVDEFEVPVNTELFFTWVGTAEEYGGTIEGYNWGIDIVDLDREGPGSGWQGWSTIERNLSPIIFREPGLHFLYVKVRDSSGITTLVTIALRAVDFPLTREILVIDDYRDLTDPRDNVHDAFWDSLLVKSGRFTEVDLDPATSRFHSHGVDDLQFRDPITPKLSQFGQYKLIVYDNNAGGYNATSGLLISGPLRRHIGAYLRAGGKMWVSGVNTVSAMTVSASGLGDFTYPKELNDRHFGWRFFKLLTLEVSSMKGERTDRNGLIRVEPFPGRPAYLPAMDIDTNKLPPALRQSYGVGGIDVITEPIFQGLDANFEGTIDSLYIMRAVGPYRGVGNSVFDQKLVGHRWHDPDPDRTQGRIMWFGFPLYYFFDDQVQETFNRAVDWFREEQLGQPAP